MTAHPTVVAAQRLVTETSRIVRRFFRQVERRVRYRRLGWV
jgi:hypothetical protein